MDTMLGMLLVDQNHTLKYICHGTKHSTFQAVKCMSRILLADDSNHNTVNVHGSVDLGIKVQYIL